MKFSFADVSWGLSKKEDGPMKLLFDGAVDSEAVANRKKFFDKLKIDTENIVSVNVIHGAHVAVVTQQDRGRLIPETDGLVTNQRNIFLTATAADCVPIYFYDDVSKTIGLAHSGWKGTLQNIAQATVDALRKNYHSEPANIHVYIGPRIQVHHFEVKKDVSEQFQGYAEYVQMRDGRIFIDLGAIIQKQLIDAGLLPSHIEADTTCTYCDEENYFSFRRDKPKKLEAMIAYIGMR